MKTIIFCLSLIVCMSVHATQFRGGDNIVISSDELVGDDLFIGAQRLTIAGTVDGDLVAGGRTIGVDGEVRGDMIAGAEHISISGLVADDVRLGAREIMVTGTVESNALCFCQSLELKNRSRIGRDLTVYAGEVLIGGNIGGKVSGAMGTARISGKIDGDVEISTESLLLLSSAEILGNLTYRSPKPAEIAGGAQIHGEIIHRVKEKIEPGYKAPTFAKLGKIFHRIKWIFIILFFVASTIVGLVFIALATKLSEDTADAIRSSPWKCLGLGFLTLIVVPIAVFIVSITVVGLPLGMIALELYLICLYLGLIIFGLFLGRFLFQVFGGRTSPYLALIIGMVVLFFLGLIPYLGWVIMFVVLLFGLGAIILTAHRKRKELKEKKVV